MVGDRFNCVWTKFNRCHEVSGLRDFANHGARLEGKTYQHNIASELRTSRQWGNRRRDCGQVLDHFSYSSSPEQSVCGSER